MEHALTPWVTFGIIPVFALANAGVDLSRIEFTRALTSSVTLGTAVGLLVGKFTGVAGFCWLAVRLGFGELPKGAQWKHVLGAAWLAGIGFTMSLFVTQLAFRDPILIDDAKLGILVGSACSAAIGLTWLFWAGRTETRVRRNTRT
jgi:NhaA family Na+:H+ antiporter